jgi:hypothetical protein
MLVIYLLEKKCELIYELRLILMSDLEWGDKVTQNFVIRTSKK